MFQFEQEQTLEQEQQWSLIEQLFETASELEIDTRWAVGVDATTDLVQMKTVAAELERLISQDNEERLRKLCKCPMGYKWHREGTGWRCDGGTHFVSQEELERVYMK